MEMKIRHILRNDSMTNWNTNAKSIVLLKGEPGIEFVNGVPKMKIGNGESTWDQLPYVKPDIETWGDLLGTTDPGKTTTTQYFGLTKPGLSDSIDIRTLNANTDIIDSQIAVTDSRVSNLLNEFDYGNVEYDNAELLDIRVGYDGVTHTSAGDAVRAIGYGMRTLRNELSDFIDAEAVDGLLYEGNKLYLTAKGVIVSDPVEIIGGSGGGGSGGGSTYTISLMNLLDSRVISAAKGETVELKFNYSSVDEDNYDDGPGIGYITVNNVRRATISIPQGDYSLDVTNYLVDGTNTVKIQVENSEGSTKTLTYTINVLALSVTTTLAELGLYTGSIGFPYIVTGQGTKVVHFIMDGREMGVEEVTTSGHSRVFTIPTQADGGHIVEVYAEVESEGVVVRSNVLRVGMMWYSSTMTQSAVLMMNYDQTEVNQGETISIPYIVYDPYSENVEITLSIIDESGATYSEKTITVDHTAKTWTTQDYPAGQTIFRITCGDAVENVSVKVHPSTFDLEVIEDSKVLEFTAQGRSNGETNPEHWEYNDITATFSGFGWTGADGWLEDKKGQSLLRFLPGNSMNIPFLPFSSDIRSSGYTIEAELATHNVRDYDTVVLECVNGGRGFVIKSQQAELTSEQSAVSVQFKEDDRIRLTFVVEQRNLNRFIYVYINGIMSGVVQYPDNDNFSQSSPVGITIGAESCGLDLYVLRMYNKGLTRDEQLNNFICDRPTLAERMEADERNDVLNSNGQVTVATLPMTVPYIILECEELPQYKGDKKSNKSVTFVDPMNPDRSFTATGVQLDVQGTSSAGYPVKNYKVKLKGGLTYTNSGKYTADGFPIFTGGLPGETICLKADFASSESANNVMLVDFYEELCPWKTPPQESDGRVRQGIRGFACCVFWHNTTNGEISLIGRYNFNDDKSNENVFGFDRDAYPNCECWEVCNNVSQRVIFKTSDYTTTTTDEDGNTYPAWYDDFEARFPDLDEPHRDYAQLKRLTDWLVLTDQAAVDSEEGKALRLQKFKDEFDQYLIKEPWIFHYVMTEVFLMVDNRAKNMFLTTFDGNHWFPIPYDWDTAIGMLKCLLDLFHLPVGLRPYRRS